MLQNIHFSTESILKHSVGHLHTISMTFWKVFFSEHIFFDKICCKTKISIHSVCTESLLKTFSGSFTNYWQWEPKTNSWKANYVYKETKTHHKICRGRGAPLSSRNKPTWNPTWHLNRHPLDLLVRYLILTQYVCRGRSPALQNKPNDGSTQVQCMIPWLR